MNTPLSRKCSDSLIRSPSRAPWVNGLDGSIESTAISRSDLRNSAVRAPISVLLPTPGGPVKPVILAPPVLGKTSRTRSQPAGSSDSIRVIARARARLSPPSRRSAKGEKVAEFSFIGAVSLEPGPVGRARGPGRRTVPPAGRRPPQ